MQRKYRGVTRSGSAPEPDDMESIGVLHPRPITQERFSLWVLDHESDDELTMEDLKPVECIDQNTMCTRGGLMWRRYVRGSEA